VRETVTPAVLQLVVWTGANLSSFTQASTALSVLSKVDLSLKQVRRITQQIGQDRVVERQQQVAQFQAQPLMERVESPAEVRRAELGVVLMDGGRYQRRDHFGEPGYTGGHWNEDKVGNVLHMASDVHDQDPHPEFPEWLARADVVRQIAALGEIKPGEIQPENTAVSAPVADLVDFSPSDEQSPSDWSAIAPRLVSREVIASSACGADFGWHLEQAAWQAGVVDAPRSAFVADGASVNWTIHRQHFSQMTGILDLMHALSYAWKAAAALNDGEAYTRYATSIWQGRVEDVIAEWQGRLAEASLTEEHRESVRRAVTYYQNHRERMDYPRYRQQGLPLTSSHIESTIKQINQRMKGSEKFFRRDTGDTLLQLRADSLSDSRPLDGFWIRWFRRQTGANTYRKQAA
jgi:hypothetical protein